LDVSTPVKEQMRHDLRVLNIVIHGPDPRTVLQDHHQGQPALRPPPLSNSAASGTVIWTGLNSGSSQQGQSEVYTPHRSPSRLKGPAPSPGPAAGTPRG
jgi:hypothetical protein